jgi:glycosyltransferase involved in cell wall biosynthesis
MTDAVLVVLPTLGRRMASLRDALQSVDDQRAEVDLRLVVVLPVAATDARLLAVSFGADLVDDPKLGLAAAMNVGVAARAGETFYVGLGDDDLLRPHGIKTLLGLAAKLDNTVVAYGACDYIDGDSRIIGTNRAGRLASIVLSWGPNLIPHPGALIDLDALEKVGGFAENRPYTMDLDAFLRLKRIGRFVCTKVPVSAFRWHADSLTVADRKTSAREALDVKRNYLTGPVRGISLLWLGPISMATIAAGELVSWRARRLSRQSENSPAV